jgi:transcriptional regulator with XRE-family HTH domain
MDSQRTETHQAQPAMQSTSGPWEPIFVENMRRLRENSKMTQTDLAKALKSRGLPFHQQTIQRIENGERPVRLNEAFLIARELEIELDTMVSRLITEADDVPLEIERLSQAGTITADNLGDEYDNFMPTIERFFFAIWPLVPQVEVGDDGQPTKTPAERFHDLPHNLRAALAACVKIQKLALDLEKLFMEFGGFFGDERAEHRPELWSFTKPVPDCSIICELNCVLEWDCEELRELSKMDLGRLHVAALRNSEPISHGWGVGDDGKPVTYEELKG